MQCRGAPGQLQRGDGAVGGSLDPGPAGRAEAAAGPGSVDVAFLPSALEPAGVVIVVDVLRASSTIVAALAAGYERVLCVATVEEARALRAPNRLLAGEQDTRPVEDFDLDNSPAGLGGGDGRELVLCTTNGTPAIHRAAASAGEVLIGSLLNLGSLAAAVPEGAAVTVVCAGTDGGFSLDDAYTAGRIADTLAGERDDSANAAVGLTRAYPDALAALSASGHAGVLREVGQASDIELCARESVFDVVPRVEELSDGAAIVSAARSPGHTDREVPLASSA